MFCHIRSRSIIFNKHKLTKIYVEDLTIFVVMENQANFSMACDTRDEFVELFEELLEILTLN